jgi:hypothetical protein
MPAETIAGKAVRPEAAWVGRPRNHTVTGAALGSEKFIRMPVNENPRRRHNYLVSEQIKITQSVGSTDRG